MAKGDVLSISSPPVSDDAEQFSNLDLDLDFLPLAVRVQQWRRRQVLSYEDQITSSSESWYHPRHKKSRSLPDNINIRVSASIELSYPSFYASFSEYAPSTRPSEPRYIPYVSTFPTTLKRVYPGTRENAKTLGQLDVGLLGGKTGFQRPHWPTEGHLSAFQWV
ncbi:hypothetical protein EX30DRAFT_233341 [Ascodesmis nigricans]|uniref:Uncharacterized protein n=1 Tax=Ascodesmis nigricans TaxID=341454 RepID=A0A4S2MYG2_9PEZI|nr:hypothetical protein EX30DRAFT_233341 [Ascodesmis nigricans]